MPKQHAQLGMWLDNYDNLFSDFDSSPYAKRQISSDFLSEAAKIFQEINPKHFQLSLFLPKQKRRPRIEKIITQRLKTVFKHQHDLYRQQYYRTLTIGLSVTGLGALTMIATTTIEYMQWQSFGAKLLMTFLEPSSWYAIWYGLDQIFLQSPVKKKDLKFHYHLSQALINFQND